MSNEYLEDGVKELPLNVKKSLNDTRLFINNTKQVRNIIKHYNIMFINLIHNIYYTIII